MNRQGFLDGFTTPPMTRAAWEAACKNEARNQNSSQAEVIRLRAVLGQIADAPDWQGALMTRLARKALGREE